MRIYTYCFSHTHSNTLTHTRIRQFFARTQAHGAIFTQSSSVFSAWLHAECIVEDVLCLSKDELDGITSDTQDKTLERNFTCTLHCSPAAYCRVVGPGKLGPEIEAGIANAFANPGISGLGSPQILPCVQDHLSPDLVENTMVCPSFVSGVQQDGAYECTDMSLKADCVEDSPSVCATNLFGNVASNQHGDGFVVNILTDKCRWYQAKLMVFESTKIKLRPFCSAGAVTPGISKWLETLSLSSTFSSISSTSWSSSSDAMYDLSRLEFNNIFQTEAVPDSDSSSWASSNNMNRDAEAKDLVFHMAKVARYYQDFPHRDRNGNYSSKGGRHLGGDRIVIEFTNGKNLQIISPDAFTVMQQLSSAALAVDKTHMMRLMGGIYVHTHTHTHPSTHT